MKTYVALEKLLAADLNEIVRTTGLYATDAGGDDTYAITVYPVPDDYEDGDEYTFKPATGNTGACTLNVNTLGAISIKKFKGSAKVELDDFDIRAGEWVRVKYDGTDFVLFSKSRLLKADPQTLTTSSTTEKTIATYSVPAGLLAPGRAIRIKTCVKQSQSGNQGTFTYKLKYGSTTLITGAVSTGDGSNRDFSGLVEAVLYYNGATNAQYGSLAVVLARAGAVTSNTDPGAFAGSGTSAEDSTSALTLELTITSTSSYTADTYGSTIEIL